MSQAETLKKIFLFRECAIGQLIKLSNYMQKVSFNRGDLIFRRGDPGDALYLVREGEVEVLAPSDEGERVEDVVAVIGPDALLGEMALVEGDTRSATVRARSDVKLLRLPKEYFENMVREDVEFAAKIFRPLTMILSKRLRETTERLAIANQVIRLVSGKQTKQE